MSRAKDKPSPERAVAQVALRTASGRSIREIGEGPPPADLSPYRVDPELRQRVSRVLERLGFSVFADASGATLSIEGPPALFERVFGITPARLQAVRATDTVRLTPPAEIRPDVDDIVVLPKPEFFPE
jgi:hypothetical protein